MISITDIASIVGIPMLRSVLGWLKKATADGKITEFEINQLVSTTVRVGSIAVMAYMGLNGIGFDVSGLGAGAGAFVADIFFKSLKEYKDVKK